MFMYAIHRYHRYWALYEKDELVCVTVYKKGAVAVKLRLEAGPTVGKLHQPSENTFHNQNNHYHE